jgi:GntR family transcriptional repressor for pyruvate dehydrogenase complex
MSKPAKNLPQKLADDILSLIVSNHMQPGEKLPNETILSEKLNAGRSSVREAMKLLVSRNIIEVRQGSGTYVSSRMGMCDDPLGLVLFGDNPKLVYDLIQIRILVEPAIAAMAASSATESDIREIYRLCEEAEKKFRAGEDSTEADIAFHQAVARGSKNLVAPRLTPIINRTVESVAKMTRSKPFEDAFMIHRDIAEAIAAHDQTEAKDAMLLHLIISRRAICAMMKCPDQPEKVNIPELWPVKQGNS